MDHHHLGGVAALVVRFPDAPQRVDGTLAALKHRGRPGDRLPDDEGRVCDGWTRSVGSVKNPSRFARGFAGSSQVGVGEEEDAGIERDGASNHRKTSAEILSLV